MSGPSGRAAFCGTGLGWAGRHGWAVCAALATLRALAPALRSRRGWLSGLHAAQPLAKRPALMLPSQAHGPAIYCMNCR